MSSDPRFLLPVIHRGNGIALDLGGGKGHMRKALEAKGYRYINLDIRRFDNDDPTVQGSAQSLPFKDEVFDLVMSKDSLEHFLEPWEAVKEVHRVLKPGGLFIIWVPFMHGFHGDDTYRYTHLGLRYLLRDFEILSLETPLWVFTLMSQVFTAPLIRLRLHFLATPIRRLCEELDLLLSKRSRRPKSLAVAYRVVARRKISDEYG